MELSEAFEELKSILVTRLKVNRARVAELTLETTLPKGLEGSLGFDSLDFIELSLALEDRFGIVIDDPEELTPHFQSLDTLSRFICAKADGA